MGGFLSGLLKEIGPRLEEKHEEDLALRRQKKQGEYTTYWQAMQTAATRLSELKDKGDLSPEEEREAQRLASQYAWSEEQLGKLTKSAAPLSEAFQKVSGFVKEMLGRPSPRGRLQAPTSAATPPFVPRPAYDPFAAGETGDFEASPSARLQPPAPIQLNPMQEAMALTDPVAAKRRNEETDYQLWLKRGKEVLGEDADPRDLAEYAGSKGTRLPARAAVVKRTAERWKVGDKEIDVDVDPTNGKRYTPQGEEWEIPEGATRVAARTQAARPTILASDYVTLKNAKALRDAGAQFILSDDETTPIDLEKIPEGMVLQRVHVGNKTYYAPRNINDKTVTFGNIKYAVNPSEVQSLRDPKVAAEKALGLANTGAVSTREVAAEDAAGNPIAMPLHSSRTPVTLPVRSGAPGAPPAGAAPAARGPAAAAPSASGVRTLPGFTPAQAERARQRVIPVREAATQIFGDPTNPDMKGLKDYAHLASNPKSRERLGKAFKLTLDWMEHGTGGGHINAAAGPVSVALARPLEWVENYFGLPPAVAQQRADIMNKAMQELTPEERDAYNATMSAFGTIVGLRSLTRASAAQASVRTIEREMPIIGVNTADAAQFMDQMGRLAEIIYNGSRDKSTQAIMDAQTPGLLKLIEGLPAEAKRMKGQQQKPSPNGTLRAPGAAKVKVWNPQAGKFEEK